MLRNLSLAAIAYLQLISYATAITLNDNKDQTSPSQYTDLLLLEDDGTLKRVHFSNQFGSDTDPLDDSCSIGEANGS